MGENSEQVELNIPLRFIFKPSYSPHCINTNVEAHIKNPKPSKISFLSFENSNFKVTFVSWKK